VLEEEATLLEETKGSQIMGSKCKDITARDEKRHNSPPRRLKESNKRSTMRVPQLRWGVLIPVRGV